MGLCLPPLKRVVAASLALCGGYVDVICVVRYETFVVTMTGNLVITGQTFFEVLPPEWFGEVRGHEHLTSARAAYLVAFRCAVMMCNCLGAFAISWVHRLHPNFAPSTAAPFIAILAVLPDVAPLVGMSENDGELNHESWLSMWSVLALAVAGGATHFLCSPAFDGSRLKAVTMAATGHMHGVTKLCYRLTAGETPSPADWEKFRQSMTISVGMAIGAVIGAAAMHLNPLGKGGHDWLLVPVAVILFLALRAHDRISNAPAGSTGSASVPTMTGNMEALREPMLPSKQTPSPAP